VNLIISTLPSISAGDSISFNLNGRIDSPDLQPNNEPFKKITEKLQLSVTLPRSREPQNVSDSAKCLYTCYYLSSLSNKVEAWREACFERFEQSKEATMKALRNFFFFVILLCVLSGTNLWAVDCKTTVTLESVKYVGQTVGAGGQKVDQFAVSWGARRACNNSGEAFVKLTIKRLSTTDSVSATHVDSSRPTGNLINLTIPRAALQTDPKSWTVEIKYTPVAKSVRSIRISGTGNPNLSTATVGPISGGPIGENLQAPSVLQAGGKIRKASVEPGVWQSNLAIAPDLLPVQLHSGSSATCFQGSLNATGLTYTPAQSAQAESVKVDWNGVPPSCEKIIDYVLRREFVRQDGTKVIQGPTTFGANVTTFSGPLTNGTSPIASYVIDITFHTIIDFAQTSSVDLTQSGNF
jgi:hypothetical protein